MMKRLFTVTLCNILILAVTSCGAASEAARDIAPAMGPYRVVPPLYREAPLSVNGLKDGRDYPVNLLRLTGAEGKTFIVNGAPADGTLLSLAAGKNAIEVKNGDGSVAEHLTVTFTPPLAVYLTDCIMNGNYSAPVTVKGFVNRPDAAVTVNNRPATVAPDGAFTASVQLSYGESNIQAIAVAGNETTQHTVPQALTDDGSKLEPVPGSALRYATRFLPPDADTISLRPGGMAGTGLTVQVSTYDGAGPETISLKVRDTHPGLRVSLTPDEFAAYPNINYRLAVTFAAGPDATPGEYAFRIGFGPEETPFSMATIKVVILP